MTIRSTRTTVSFCAPFTLAGHGEPLPAGDYVVETDEEPLDSVTVAAWRRVSTLLLLPPSPASPGRRQALPIDPADLAAALARDREGAGSVTGQN